MTRYDAIIVGAGAGGPTSETRRQTHRRAVAGDPHPKPLSRRERGFKGNLKLFLPLSLRDFEVNRQLFLPLSRRERGPGGEGGPARIILP